MGLNTYSGLKTAVLTWLAKTGDTLTEAAVPDMVTLFEVHATRVLFNLDQDLEALAANNQSNWLLANHPDAYLFGTLCEAEPFIGHDERFPLWKARRDEVLNEILRDRLSDQVTPVTSYATLNAAVYHYLGRPRDGVLAGVLPDLIGMFEAEARRRLRNLSNISSLTTLSDAATTNWLLTAHPDAYVFGSLAAAEPFLPPGDERVNMWKARRDEVLNMLAAGHRGLP